MYLMPSFLKRQYFSFFVSMEIGVRYRISPPAPAAGAAAGALVCVVSLMVWVLLGFLHVLLLLAARGTGGLLGGPVHRGLLVHPLAPAFGEGDVVFVHGHGQETDHALIAPVFGLELVHERGLALELEQVVEARRLLLDGIRKLAHPPAL